jgi:hypothetical protein
VLFRSDDIDSLAAFIEGDDSKPKKPKKRKPKKKATDSIQIGDTKLEATQPLSISVKPVTHSLQEGQSSAVEHSKGKTTLDASLMSSEPSTAEMDEEEEAFIFEYINYNQPREIKN